LTSWVGWRILFDHPTEVAAPFAVFKERDTAEFDPSPQASQKYNVSV
jgi:hypothetical protein